MLEVALGCVIYFYFEIAGISLFKTKRPFLGMNPMIVKLIKCLLYNLTFSHLSYNNR